MKLIKSLLLGTAAGIAATAGAQAADLPSKKAAPVDYVRVCSINNAFTGFVIPGSDICLKVGGFVRYNAVYNEPRWTVPGNGRNANALTQRAIASIKFDARQTTEYGLLRSFFDVRVGQVAGGVSSSAIDKAYIQFAGLHAGKVQSLFDFYADDASYGDAGLGSDHSAVALGYTFQFGGGFYAVVSLEDPSVTRNNAAAIPYGGQRVPDVVGAVGIDAAWGSAKLSAAGHQLYTPNVGFGGRADNEYGFAVQGGVKVNIPQLGPSDALWLQAAYADGATTYLGLPGTAFGNLGGAGYFSAYDYSYNNVGSLKKTTGYNITAAFEHMWNPNWGTNVFGGYTKYDPSGTIGNFAFTSTGVAVAVRKAEVWQVGGNVTWFPVKGLKIAAEATYFNVKLNAPVFLAGTTITKKSDNVLQGYLRIQRDF
jgi:hypothetical protein